MCALGISLTVLKKKYSSVKAMSGTVWSKAMPRESEWVRSGASWPLWDPGRPIFRAPLPLYSFLIFQRQIHYCSTAQSFIPVTTTRGTRLVVSVSMKTSMKLFQLLVLIASTQLHNLKTLAYLTVIMKHPSCRSQDFLFETILISRDQTTPRFLVGESSGSSGCSTVPPRRSPALLPACECLINRERFP